MPALDTFFGELHSLSAFEQAPAPGLILDHVAQEKLPLALEGIVVGVLLRDLLPAFEIVERAIHVGVPNGARRIAVVLCPAVAQTGDSGALGAIDLDGEQVDGTKGTAVAGLRHCWTQHYGNTPRPVWNPDVDSPLNYFEGWQKVPEQDT